MTTESFVDVTEIENVPALFTHQDYVNELTQATERQSMFCSLNAETPSDKKVLFNAMNSSDNKVADCVGETIEIKDVFCETVTVVNSETGEKNVAPRVVLIDTKGKSYTSTSYGIFNALKKLMVVYGVPTWEKGVKVKIKQINREKNRILTFEVV